jgi:oligosaccharide repeat unit polymerase
LQSRKLTWFVLFAVSFVTAFLYAAVSIEKTPVAAIILLLFLAYYLYRGGRVGKMVVVSGVVLFLLFPLVVIALTYGSGTAVAFQSMTDRIFVTPADVMYYYFEIFPGVVPFQHGATIGKLAALMGWRLLNVPNIVGLYMLRTEARFVPTVTANAGFIANLFVDFGMTGVLLGGAIAGFLLQAFQVVIIRRPKTPASLVCFAFLIWIFTKLTTNPLPTILLSEGAVTIFALVWLTKHLELAFRRTEDASRLRPSRIVAP